MDERTEVPSERTIDGEASPVPPMFFWTLWIGAFFVTLWGMLILFGGRGRREEPPEPPHDT